ncbi:anti-sigma factor family protein [Bradyrhizobium erythrophlei]|uniref:Transmembrane transcriptional regulator (Anti-sigma factor RsiW) n=1 Tax=Bradyrhizobium erythrophlei TaxID=1437360 RepID=A0A1M7TPZ7_9BRAD|nr:anti-sigma factor [Bradyrhizobium erythrophlei]SHN72770.1 Transmembrane transcriptional regulator (anti-sigma factor RsiW) [Bradyrhizobium erythrophlei]
MAASLQDNDELKLTAYCDGELDPVAAGEFERRMAADDKLQARYTRLMSLRNAMQALPQADMPSDLQARIQARLNTEQAGVERANAVSNVTVLRRRNWSFQALAASAVFGAVISGSVLKTIDRLSQDDTVASEVVAGHIRGLLAPQPFDIASSDRHTVKPWFTSRLPESPQVPDLAEQGFALLGGRVDVIDNRPVATIVYKHAAHTVSLTTLKRGQSVPDQNIAGYNVRSWSDGNFTYVAVCDLPSTDLAVFEQAFAAAAPAPEIKQQ